MAAQLPDSRAVQTTVAVLNSDQVVSDAQLRDLLDSPALNAGLDRWQLWTLVCLCRHISRQKWVGYIVETRLKEDLAKLGTAVRLGIRMVFRSREKCLMSPDGVTTSMAVGAA